MYRIVLLLLAMTCPVLAQSSPLTTTLYWENDGTVLKPNNETDRHYTNGLALTLAGPNQTVADIGRELPLLGMDASQMRGSLGLIAGQLIFTPDNIDSRDPIPTDRPYAGYLFLGGYAQRADDHVMDHVQVDLGLIGPSSGSETVQRGVHSLFALERPSGWDNQLHDEPTIQFYARRKYRFDFFDNAAQVIPEAGLALGTVYRHLEGHVTLRAGWNLPDDFGPGRIANVGSTFAIPDQGWMFYVFGRVGGRVVQHNTFLDGNNYRDSLGIDEERLVGEAQLGLTLRYALERWAIGATYAQTFLTHEYERQPSGDAFGALSIFVTCGY